MGRVGEIFSMEKLRIVNSRRCCNKENDQDIPPDKNCLGRCVLRATGMREEFIHIARSWTTVPKIATEFCAYFTDIIPSGDETEPLVVKCGKNAIERWMLAEEKKLPDVDRFRAFLRGLFDIVPEVNTWCVFPPHDPGDIVWDPARDSLSDWWRMHGSRPRILRRGSHLNRISDSDLRLFIATKILSRDDVAVLLGGLRAISQEIYLVPSE